MPTSSSQHRQIRVFLSSTFQDMEQERHELLTRVFPLFRQRCLERQVVFSDIDLGWGITEEEAHNDQTVQIRLHEIARCRALGTTPFFIGFIGERYGWVPPPHELASDWQSTTADNHPYARCLEAARAERISVTELEMRVGFMDDASTLRHRVQLYFRHPDLTATFAGDTQNAEAPFYEHSADGRDKLETLKAVIRTAHAECIGIDGYRDISEFGQHVLHFLSRQLDTHFPLAGVPDEHQLKQHAQQCYARSRCACYVPLTAFKHQVATWIQHALEARWSADGADSDGNRLALIGPSGCGKSAFMADFASINEPENGLMIAHFMGADGDNSPEGWRERVLQALKPYLPSERVLSADNEQRWAEFPALVSEAQERSGKPLILLLDAINQFSSPQDGMRRLSGLRFSPGTVLLVSSTDAFPQGWPTLAFPLLDNEGRRKVIALFLYQHNKTLPTALVEQVVAAPACGNALFLRLVLEDPGLHADDDSRAARISTLLNYADAGELFLALLNETDRDFRAQGDSLASRATTLIAATRAGVTHRDLAVLLVPQLRHPGPKMADQSLLRLLARIAPFCLNDGGRIRIAHAVFTQTLDALSPLMAPSRRALAAYFSQSDAFSVAERTFQWLALENEEHLVATLGRLDVFATLQQRYAWLASHAMTVLGAGRSSLSLPLNAVAESWQDHCDAGVLNHALNQVSGWFLSQGFLLIGVRWSDVVMAQTRLAFPDDVEQVTTSANNLGLFYRLLGRYDEAEALLCAALAHRRQSLPAPHPGEGVLLNNLASVYGALGRYRDAEPLLLEAQKCLHVKDSIDYANITQSLGECYLHLDMYEKAEPLMLSALAVRERLQARDTPDLIGIKRSLGRLYMHQARYREAEPILRHVLALRQTSLPPTHSDIALSLHELGELYYRQGNGEKAEPLFKQMLDIKRKSLPPGHPGLALGLQSMAELYRSQNRYEQAESLYLDALHILTHSLPAGHNDLISAQNYLASLYIEQAHYEKAIPLYEAMLAAQVEPVFPDNPDVLERINVLPAHPQAAYLYRKLLDMIDPLIPDDHPEKVNLLQRLAEVSALNAQAGGGDAAQTVAPVVSVSAQVEPKRSLGERLRDAWRRFGN